MRLQLICFVVLKSLCCHISEAAVQPAAVHVIVDRGVDFYQWLATILLPTTYKLEPESVAATLEASQVEAAATTSYPLDRECSACRCGLIYTVNGREASRESSRHHYPWLAMVLLQGQFYCAGSLISDLYVLTAGHCVEGMSTELIQVHLLEHNRSLSADAQVLERRARHVKVHELYNPRSLEHDIALIRLDRPVSFEQRLRPVCLSPTRTSLDGELARLTSWLGPRQALQEIDVLIIGQSECRNSSHSSAMISDNMLCARHLDDSCRDNDSGGLLHVLLDELLGQYQLIGLVSWGADCAHPQSPGVYTHVNQYLRWIEANTANACYCTPFSEEED